MPTKALPSAALDFHEKGETECCNGTVPCQGLECKPEWIPLQWDSRNVIVKHALHSVWIYRPLEKNLTCAVLWWCWTSIILLQIHRSAGSSIWGNRKQASALISRGFVPFLHTQSNTRLILKESLWFKEKKTFGLIILGFFSLQILHSEEK